MIQSHFMLDSKRGDFITNIPGTNQLNQRFIARLENIIKRCLAVNLLDRPDINEIVDLFTTSLMQLRHKPVIV